MNAPGNENGVGAHRHGPSTTRWWQWVSVAAFGGGRWQRWRALAAARSRGGMR
jgi:hypothetical protein